MAIVRWDPFGEAMRMQRDMDRIFARLGQSERGGENVAWMPKVDVKRSGNDVMMRAELPGLKAEDVDIELSDNVLTISGERRSEEQKEDEGWIIRETSYGSFERSLTIPEGVDPGSITANFSDGVLEVRVPGALEQAQPRRTKIEIGGQQQMQMGAGEPAMAGQQGTAGQQGMAGQQSEPAQQQGMTEPSATGQGMQTGQGQEAEEREKAGVGGRDTGQGGWV